MLSIKISDLYPPDPPADFILEAIVHAADRRHLVEQVRERFPTLSRGEIADACDRAAVDWRRELPPHPLIAEGLDALQWELLTSDELWPETAAVVCRHAL
jgi:hypothetical protein